MALASATIFNDLESGREHRKLILGLVGVALLLRLILLFNPGHLFGITEYDDGVYFGAALRLTQGLVPYKDFVMVQPPGIAVLLSPIAFLARLIGAAHGLAVARVMTVVVGAANAGLAGLVARSRGRVAVVTAGGIMALYPQAIMSSQTVLLEPYLNFFCLLALLACFRNFHMRASRSALFVGGVLLGIAGAIKVWAIIPAVVVVAVSLVSFRSDGLGKPLSLVGGMAAGFAAISGPFIFLAPSEFFRQVIAVQTSRTPGGRVGLSERMGYITGSEPLDWLFGHSHIVLIVLSAILLAAYLLALGKSLLGRSELGVFIVVTAALVFFALLWPSDFYYHYADFAAPYIALSLGVAFSVPRDDFWGWSQKKRGQAPAILGAALLLGGLALDGAYFSNLSSAPNPSVSADEAIPTGACVVSDQVSLLIVANRFFSRDESCPKYLDPYGTALALSGGKTINGGARESESVVSFWMTALQRAQFVWLTPQSTRRVPWTTTTRSYFDSNFAKISSPNLPIGTIYRRISS